jgi:hypothetical protein
MTEIDELCRTCPIYKDKYMSEKMCGHCDYWNGIGQDDKTN